MGSTLFTVGIFFYTSEQFGWSLRQNFLLAAGQGAVYIVGALLANVISRRLSHRTAATLLHAAMASACAGGVLAAWHSQQAAITLLLLLYTFLSAINWPILESLIARGTGGRRLDRRLAVYNMVWPAVGAVTVAISGRIMQVFATGVFLFPAIAHALATLLATRCRPKGGPPAAVGAGSAAAAAIPPELLRQRTVALWVSRLGLPATYAVIYGLMPLMPLLPSIERLDPQYQTVLSSAWLAARWLTFVALGMNPWWHTRPRVMVAAAALMLAAFLGVTLAPSQSLGAGVSPNVDLAAMLLWQIVLGAALGMIYSGSLHFGMVLSEGSTQHSGYHEALIGLGWVLGPAAGALMQSVRPDDAQAAILAVGGVIAASVACVIAADVIASRHQAGGVAKSHLPHRRARHKIAP